MNPPFLHAGDKIGIVAPARKISKLEVDFAVNVLSSWNLNVILSENMFKASHPYFSASDAERLADLQLMIDDPDIKAIVCARGGYGCTRILDALNLSLMKSKWVVGFSDITALHLK